MNNPSSPLRQTLAQHLGQTLTPEIAARIELASQSPAPHAQPLEALERWRHLIEPVANDGGPMSLTWPQVLATPVHLYETHDAVLVTRPPEHGQVFIWVAAGVLASVLRLFAQVVNDARESGCTAVAYLGRPGWVRAAGFAPVGILAVKEI